MKVFIIGLIRTGTTSLANCLKILGYSYYEFTGTKELLDDIFNRQDYRRTLEIAEKFDSFSDFPWSLIYKDLDERFPGSKFILTLRKNPQVWLESVKRQSIRSHPFKHPRKIAFGYNYPFGKEQEHIKLYQRHQEEVQNHFKDRPGDLLVFNVDSGDGWRKLCQFLDKKVPDREFPHYNKGKFKLTWKVPVNIVLSRII